MNRWMKRVLPGVALLLLLTVADLAAGTWLIETVDTAPYAYQGAALVVDSQGRPYISYGSWGQGMRYAWREGTGWQHTVIEGGAGVGYSDTSLALDDAGRPHVSYYDYSHGRLQYAHLVNDTDWITATIDTCGGDTSLAVNGAGQPRIAYFGPANDLRYAAFDGTAWVTTTVVTSTHWAGHLALVLDSGGWPRVLYQFDGLHYAYQDGAGWHMEVVEQYAGGGDLALDDLGQPRVSFSGFCEGGGVGPWGLCYAYRDGSGWHVSSVDTVGDTGWYSSLELDAADQPHISYYHFANKSLLYAHISGTTWLTETVDSLDAGLVSSLALAGDDSVRITYQGDDSLKYAAAGVQPTTWRIYVPLVVRP